jgi:radical SAM protein with 4Fe4S-binding SPASM domain
MKTDWKIWLGNQARRHKSLQHIARKAQGAEFILKYKHYYPTSKGRVFLSELHIEPVNYCNLRCKFCALDHQMPKQRISVEVLVAFFEQWFADSRFHQLNWIHLHNGGESLLHPKIDEILAYLATQKARAQTAGLPFPKISLLTNATVLSQQKSEMLLQHQIIDLMRFSVDGGNPENFEQMRLRAKWDVVSTNIKSFTELNNKLLHPVKTGIICLLPSDMPLKLTATTPAFQDLMAVVDSVELRRAHGWAGELEVAPTETIDYLTEKTGCMMALKSMVLLPDGSMTVCCADLNRRGVVGNILNTSLYDLYNAPKRIDMLEKLASNRKHEIDLCKNCEGF